MTAIAFTTDDFPTTLTGKIWWGGEILRYWMMRLFVLPRVQPEFPFLQTDASISRRASSGSRQEHLLAAFSREIKVRYRGHFYVYKFFNVYEPGVIGGVVGREHTITISQPPEQSFQPRDVPDWETANVFIDTAGDAD